MRNNYWKVIDEFRDYVSSNNFDNIYAIYLGGSVARDEFIPNRSDIDLYVITTKKDETIENNLLSQARLLVNINLPKLVQNCEDPISVSFTLLEELKNGTSWLGYGLEYYSFIKTSKLIYGEDIKLLLSEPNAEQSKELAQKYMTMLTENINLQNFDSVPIDILNTHIRDVINAVLKSIEFSLAYNGIYVTYKNDLLTKCSERFYVYEELLDKVKYIYSIKELLYHRNLTEEEIVDTYNFGKDIILYLNRIYMI